MKKYSEKFLRKIAVNVKNDIFERIFSLKTNIFLCGGSVENSNSIRPKIESYLRTFHPYWVNVIYPEDLFEELLVGKGSYDLLSLETMLAESVDIILIIPESPGSFTELGAFINSEVLRSKVICIQDKSYKKKKSFINYGPIKLMRTKKEGEVVFIYFARIKTYRFEYDILGFFDQDLRKLTSAINRIARKSKKQLNITNILQTSNFILPCIYLLERATGQVLIEMVRLASGETQNKSRTVVLSSLNSLTKNNLISSTPDGYVLTKSGIERFQSLGERTKHDYYYSIDSMDKIRLDILSWELRGKKTEIN